MSKSTKFGLSLVGLLFASCFCLAMALITGCGGSAFTSGPAEDAGEDADAVAADSAPDAAAPDADAAPLATDDAGDAMAPDAAPDAIPDATPDANRPDASPECLTTLSNIGAGNFSIAFTFTSTSAAAAFAEAGAASLALAAQRPTGCSAGDYWDVNLNSGKVVAQIFAVHNVVLQPDVLADDGQPHRIVFSRINGVAQLSVDSTSATAADPDSYATFPALTIGSENGCATPIAGYGEVTNVCISIP